MATSQAELRAYQNVSPFGRMASVLERASKHAEVVTWPSTRWRRDPVRFAREVLGIELWSAQVEIVNSIRDHRNTTVRSGHKCGKSTALAVAALWFYCSFSRARVMCTAVKAKQVDEVIWKEVRRLYRGALIPIDGAMNMTARSGLLADDERQIWGVTARSGEGLAGISGPNVLILADEASGISDQFFEVLGSSLAGSGGTVRKCYISNPTRTQGEFYKSHTSNSALFNCIHISSEDTPNARGVLPLIPGLAGAEWIVERKAEYGVDSYAYMVRVKGEFARGLDGKAISLEDIAEAQARWDEAPEQGDLQIGVDPAGDKIIGDESAMAIRLGAKMLTVPAWRGISEDDIVANVIDALVHYQPRAAGTPRVVVDAGGGLGTRVFNAVRARAETMRIPCDFVAVRSEQKMYGSRDYATKRDALWGQARDWIRAGGAIPDDVKLADDLNAPSFTENPKFKQFDVTPKKELRKRLGRSPDRGDAFCLATWEHASVVADDDVAMPTPVAIAARATRQAVEDPRVVNDPYAGAAMWQGRR